MAKKKSNPAVRWIHYVVLFLIIVGNINLLKGSLEVIPSLFPPIANEIDGKIERGYIKSRSTKDSEKKAVAHYIEARYEYNGKAFTNHDWTTKEGYLELTAGTPVKMLVLKGFPGIGLIKENEQNVVRNNKIGIYIILIVDVLYIAFMIGLWRRKRKRKKLYN